LLYRDQNPENRPGFAAIVDELLVLEKEIPEARFSDVSCYSSPCNPN
jgi:hypothetical protein